MTSSPQKSSFEREQQHKRFPWILGIIASTGFLAILAFVIVTLLILQSQGIARGVNILTAISIVVSFMIGVLGLLLSFLQWHHSRPSHQLESMQGFSLQASTPDNIERLPSPGSLAGPLQQSIESNAEILSPPSPMDQRIDWGQAPHAEQFYGRDQELAKLQRWMIDDHCHLIAILGTGGMGKTSLAATLVGRIHEYFDCVFWRSLHNAPPLESTLQESILFFSGQQQIAFPAEVDSQIDFLIEYLRVRRCLLVLDNVESILQGGSWAGSYREGYEGYGKLLQRVGETRHQSCLMITSREKPREVAVLEGEATAVRSVNLRGLPPVDGQNILKDKGIQGTEDHWKALINHYEGNPLALKLVGQVIRDVFGGEITAFLTDGELFFHDIRDLLEQQVKRLSALEEEIVYWLAIEREAITLSDLQEDTVHLVSKGALQEALQSLQRRQLIEVHAAGFSLHYVIMEYLTDRFVDQVCEEIKTGRLLLFERHALLKAQAKDYIRESQRRLILQSLVRQLLAVFGEEALEQQFQRLLARLHTSHDPLPGYAAGNVLNMLVQMGCELQGYDFSRLAVRQAYLQGVVLPKVNFSYANLATSVFTDTFGGMPCVAFSPQGDLLAAGTETGEIRLWYSTGSSPLQTIQGHTGWIYSIAFSPDGKILASGGSDQAVRLWEVSSGQCLNTLQGHTHVVGCVAFSPDGKILVSGGDRTVRLWEVSSGTCLGTLQGHTDLIHSVAFSPDGKTLASGGNDRTVRLWEVSSGKHLKTLHGHTQPIWSIAFNPDGKTLASSGFDQTVRLWEVSSGQGKILQGHSDTTRVVVFSPDGKTLASCSDDHTVRLWEVSSGQCLKVLQGHTDHVLSVAFGPDGKIVASGSTDQTLRIWETSNGQCLRTLQGFTDQVRPLVFSPDGKTLAGVYEDRLMRLWEVSSGACLKTLRGHTHRVNSVAFSPDGKTFASCSHDQTVRLWEVSSGQCLKILQGHTHWISSVAFSPDGKTIASGSRDQTVRLWEVSSGQCLKILQGHTDLVHSLAFSPNGKVLASGGDTTVHLWEVSSGTSLKILQGHTYAVWSVAFSPDGKTLASCSEDDTVRLWEVSSGQGKAVLEHSVGTMSFSPDGQIIVNVEQDRTGGLQDTRLRLWDVNQGICLKTLPGCANHIWKVVFSLDGKILACGESEDQMAHLWEVSSGTQLRPILGHTSMIRSVTFSPDRKTIASGNYGGKIDLWDIQTGACLHVLRSERPYEGMNITQVRGLTEARKAALRSLGAIEEEEQAQR